MQSAPLASFLALALFVMLLVPSTAVQADTTTPKKPTTTGISLIAPEKLTGTVGILYTDKKSVELQGWAIGDDIVKVIALQSNGKPKKELTLSSDGLFTGKLDVLPSGHYIIAAEDSEGTLIETIYVLFVRTTDKEGPKLNITSKPIFNGDKVTIAGSAIDSEPFKPVKLQVLKDTFVLDETTVDKDGNFSMTFPVGCNGDLILNVQAIDALDNVTTIEWIVKH
jgi:hypothetical protein